MNVIINIGENWSHELGNFHDFVFREKLSFLVMHLYCFFKE